MKNIIQKIIGDGRLQGALSAVVIFGVILASVSNASTITTINGSDTLSSSRTVINTNFSNLNTDKVELSNTGAWTGLQKFFANASSTGFSANYASFGGTATTTFTQDGRFKLGTSTSGVLYVDGSTGLVFSGSVGGTGTVTSVTASTPNSTLSLGGTNPVTTSGTISFDLNLGHANNWSALQQFFGNASSSMSSCFGPCYFGQTATSSFSGAGVLTLASALTVPNGGSGAATLTGLLLGNGASAFTAVTTSAGIAGALSDETGSGALVFAVSPALTGSATFVNLSGTNATSTGKLNIPNGAAPSVVTTGDVALDTTSDQLVAFGGTAKKVYGNGNQYASFTYATTSTWGSTATTTIPLGTARIAETWNDIQCFTDTGTLFVDLYHTSTHAQTRMNASTTANTNAYTSNNTLTSGEKRYVDIGTPASSPKSVSCTLSKSITAD